MAISSRTKTVPAQEVQREEDRIAKDLSSSNVIETRVVVDIDTAIIKTKQYIEGSDWEVTYYNQLASKSDTIGSLDTSIDIVEQQYVKISELNIKVTSSIPTDKLSNITGEATITEFLPLVGDFFVATLVGDITAAFVITEVTSKSYNLDRIYDISFRLDSTEISNPDKIKILEERVVRNLIYDKESVFTGSDPLLITSDMEFKRFLLSVFDRIADRYVRDFKKQSLRNFLILSDNAIDLLDQNISYLFNQLTDRSYAVNYVVEDGVSDTIIGILLEGGTEYITNVKHPMFKSPPRGSNFDYRLRGMIGLNVDLIATIDEDESNIKFPRPNSDSLPKFLESDKSYLLSSEFYNGKSKLSLIEELLRDSIYDKQIEREKLRELITLHYEYNKTELYFYVPVLLYIIKSYVNYTYSKG